MRTLATSICLSFNNQLHGESCAVWKRSCAVWSCAVWERCSCLIRSHKPDLIKQLHGGCLHCSCHLVSPSIFFHRATRATVLWSFSLKMMNLDRNVCFVLLSAAMSSSPFDQKLQLVRMVKIHFSASCKNFLDQLTQ